jgi:CRP/FNR family nitrogen fixation transcriptional regulator
MCREYDVARISIGKREKSAMLTETAVRNGLSGHLFGRTMREPSVGPQVLTGPIELMGASMSFARNMEVYGEEEPADYLYKVISGAVRTYKVLIDGRRQIGAFYLPGDIFGLETGEEQDSVEVELPMSRRDKT